MNKSIASLSFSFVIPGGLQDVSLPTSRRTECPNHWTTKEIPTPVSLQSFPPDTLSHPVPRQPLICFQSLQISLHYIELHINRIIQYIFLLYPSKILTSFTRHNYFNSFILLYVSAIFFNIFGKTNTIM